MSQSRYEPWKEHYLDYTKLKSLLREKEAAGSGAASWIDDDEERFIDELVNVQLEKVNAFQEATHRQLDEKMNRCQAMLDNPASSEESNDEAAAQQPRQDTLEEVQQDLDDISREVHELERFSRMNYTGALKAAKKHDRRRGTNYKVRPLVQVRLASLPFNTEDYSPFLYRLSGMYAFVRQHLGNTVGRTPSNPDPRAAEGDYVSHKFFIHPDNLLEVKTMILRHLPVLLFTPSSIKDVGEHQRDPTMTALYLDNSDFTLYTGKLERGKGSSSLRIRWYDRLAENPEVILEKKTLREGDDSDEVKIKIKDKFIMPFLRGEHKMEKMVQKLRNQKGANGSEVKELERNVSELQTFVRQNRLEPMLRANYTRTAFQIPGEDRVRISIDTNLAFIREDCLDSERPCRDPNEWHKIALDESGLDYPFTSINKGEISHFPYAVMEVKVRQGMKKRRIEWIEDLMTSHLVKEAPRFSKFLHGVAALFEDDVNSMPFWMSLTDTDIRRDPEEAFQEEQDKKAKQAEDEFVVGSLLGSIPKSKPPHFEPAVSSPIAKKDKGTASDTRDSEPPQQAAGAGQQQAESGAGSKAADSDHPSKTTRLRDLFPSFSTSKYARALRSKKQLPPGIKKPEYFLKDVGEVKVEPKVWLANQR